MSGIFIDSCQHYDLNSINQKYNQSGGLTLITAPPNFGLPGQCISLGSTGSLTKVIPLNSHLFLGWRCQLNYPGQGAPGGTALFTGGCVSLTRTLLNVVSVFALNDGTFAAYAGFNNYLMCKSNPKDYTIADGIPFYLEIEVQITTITNSQGIVNLNAAATIYVNGNYLINGSADTQIPLASTINDAPEIDILNWGTAAGDGTTYFRDLYVFDNSSGYNNGRIGDVSILAIYPRSDSSNNWTPVDTPHWNLLNEHPPDGDTTYIYTSTVGLIDSWYMQLISSFTGTILGAQFLLYSRKDAEGTRVIQAFSNGELDSFTDYLGDAYRYFIKFYDNQPGGGAWTPQLLNGTAFGVQLTQ